MESLDIVRISRTTAVPLASSISATTADRSTLGAIPKAPTFVHADGDGPADAVRLILNTFAVFSLCLLFGLGTLATAPRLIGFETVVVASGSMEPSLRVADVVVLADPGERQVRLGSVINYTIFSEGQQGASQSEARIHRVVEVVPEGGYRTQGDANPVPDSGVVAQDKISGIGIYLVPLVGFPRQWLANGEWWRLAIGTLGLFVLVFFSRDSFIRARDRRVEQIVGGRRVVRRSRRVEA